MNPTDRITPVPALPNQGGQTNVPGIRKLWLIETRYIMGFTEPRSIAGALTDGWNVTATGLQIAEDAIILKFTFPADRGSYEQKAGNSVHGVVYSHDLKLDVPRDHPLVALAVMRMSGRKFVAFYQDGNGLYKMIGTPKQPVRFLASTKTAPNSNSFSWSGQTRYPSYFFTDIGLLSFVNDDSEFSYGFSYDFYS